MNYDFDQVSLTNNLLYKDDWHRMTLFLIMLTIYDNHLKIEELLVAYFEIIQLTLIKLLC